MSSLIIVRKVPFKLASNRFVWGIVLAEREGLSLLFIRKPNENQSHALVLAQENPAEGVFEDVQASRFPLESEDITDIGNKLNALGNGLRKNTLEKFFESDDSRPD
jgi:hypothetical protein